MDISGVTTPHINTRLLFKMVAELLLCSEDTRNMYEDTLNMYDS